MITAREALSFVKLTAAEEHELTKLEAVVDGLIFSHFDGSPFNVTLADFISPKLASALQRKFELRAFNDSAFWQVAYKPIEGADEARRYTFSFSPVILPEVPDAAAKPRDVRPLPPVMSSVVQVPVTGKRLLVRMPTRGRPAQAIDVLTRYRTMAGMPITIEVVIDENDASMMAPEVIQRLYALGCVITVGRHEGKIEAVNGGRRDLEWDVLLLASDDMLPVLDGYAVRVMAAMGEHFPHLDGAVYFNDGYANERLCTLPIMGRRLYEQFGFVYNQEYQSLFCDEEQTLVLNSLGRLKYIDEKIIEHRHWVVGAPKDATYVRNDALWDADKATFARRKDTRREHAQLGFDMPAQWLSVCICSLPSRKTQLERLLDHLWHQIRQLDAPLEVEILVDDREAITIGEKRQALLERTKSHFVCFVDDDDWVSPRYLSRILGALKSDPAADCASLNGVMTTAGSSPEPFYNSIANSEWYSKGKEHFRNATHLSPVRRELALQAGFPSVSHGEDYQFSSRLRPLLKREVATGPEALYLYFYLPGKTHKDTP